MSETPESAHGGSLSGGWLGAAMPGTAAPESAQPGPPVPPAVLDAFYRHLFSASPHYRELFPATLDEHRRAMGALLRFLATHADQPAVLDEVSAQLGIDHLKYGVQPEQFTDGTRALLAALAETSDDLATLGLWSELLGQAAVTMESAASAWLAELPPYWTGTVLEVDRMMSDLAVVRIEADAPVPYFAGQYLPVSSPARPGFWRHMSVAVPPNPGGLLEFHVRKVPGGLVSPALVTATEPGQQWRIGSPLGALGEGRDGRDLLMVGIDTGIAAMRAQLLELALLTDAPRVHLFVCGHSPRDLYDLGTLWRLAATNPWLTVVPVVETLDDPWWYHGPKRESMPGLHRMLVGEPGTVVSGFGSWADRQVQLAGPPDAVRATVRALVAAGTPRASISHDPLPGGDR